jgi:hypothetical protein
MTYGDVVRVYQGVGVGQMNSRAIADTYEAFNALEKESSRLRAKTPIPKMVGWWEDKMFKWNEGIESFHRFAAMNHGMNTLGGDIWSSRAFTMTRHGDYMDLTDFEQTLKDIIPFYKWMRTNIPYQFTLLVENPVLLTSYDKVERLFYEAQGLDWWETQAKMPDYMKDSFTIPIDTKLGPGEAWSFASLDMPYQDLYMSSSDLISRTLPLVRPWIESFGIEKNIFTGKPLGAGEMVPMSNWLSSIPMVPDLLVAAGLGDITADGKYRIKASWENVMNVLPVYSRFRSWILGSDSNEEHRAAALLSLLAGMSYVPFNEDELTSEEQNFLYSQVVPTIKKLRTAGLAMPETSRIDPAAYEALGFEAPVEGTPPTSVMESLKLES